MSRNALAVGAIVVVGAALWTVMVWPAPGEDAALEPLDVESESPPAPAGPAAADLAPEEPSEPPLAAPPPTAAVPQPVAQPVAAPAAHPSDQPDMFAVEQGPVAEYRRLYESEPRDSAASDVEATIRAAFAHPGDDAPGMFRSVLCRQTICRLELNFSEDKVGAYVAGITRSVVTMNSHVAVAPAGPRRADSVRPIEVFIKRQPGAADQQRAADQQLGALQQQPAAAPGQPAAPPEQPAAAPEQPSATGQQPSAAPEEPVEAPQQPSAAPEQPSATGQQPPAAPPATTN